MVAEAALRPAVFLDRDGVIVVPEFRNGRSYAPTTLAAFAVYEDARACLERLKGAGYLIVVVTNQPDVGKGVIEPDVLEAMHARLRRELPVDGILACTHRQDEDCDCRKPKPGMLTEAAETFGILLPHSFMIGDRWSDIEAGRAAGCRTIFLDRGYDEPRPRGASFEVLSLDEATRAVLTS